MERQTRIIVSLTVLVTSIAFQSISLRPAHYESSPPDNIGVASNNTSISLGRAHNESSPPDIRVPSNIDTLQNVIGNNTIQQAIEAMRSQGYASMALFLETQPLVMDPEERESRFLIVAPSDKAVAGVKGELSPVLLRHIVKWNYSRMEEGFVRTFLPGFVITTTFMEEFEDRPNALIDDLYEYEDDENMLDVFGLQEEIFPPMLEKDVVNKRV